MVTRTEVRVDGTPVGALILDGDGRVIGHLPTTLVLENPSTEHVIIVIQKGHVPERIRFVPKKKPHLEIRLRKCLHGDLERSS